MQRAAIAFAAEAASLPAEAWTAQVQMLVGSPFAARGVLGWRLREVEIHHVNLAAGYRPADWPAEFVAGSLPEVAGSFVGREDAPTCLLRADGSDAAWQLGPERTGAPPLEVRGPAAAVLAWLIGRDDGSGLRVSGGGASAPALPPWR